MRKLTPKLVAWSLSLFAAAVTARADVITNNFDVPFDYATYGILGNTNWDGVYLGNADVPYGNFGVYAGSTGIVANAAVSYFGFLTVQTSGSEWGGSGGADDGFFLWKLVAGDFDVSVESAPPWQNAQNNFAGLMVRAFNTNGSGAPVSFTSTNAAENFLMLWRATEYSLSQIRQLTNGTTFENNFNTGTNTAEPLFFRIKRTGDTFTFYVKTNLDDAWSLFTGASPGGGYVSTNGTVTRPDWHDQPVQVGIAQAIFAAPTPIDGAAIDYFTHFGLSGPNVSVPTSFPAPASNVSISSPNPSGSVNVSWTPGAGSDGSLVLIRGAVAPNPPPIISQPIQGTTYPGDADYSNPNTLLSAGNSHVVYAGSGNSLTVTGLGGSNNTYSVAVFSYSTAGGTTPPVYDTVSPATNSFTGPGQVSGVSFTLSPSSIPVNGVAIATVTATYTTGDSYDVSAEPTTLWSSADPSVAAALNGTVSGISVGGPVQISATYAGITGYNDVTVHAPAFEDTFSTAHNYLTSGVVGSAWDGLYAEAGDVPFATAGASFMQMSNVDATISSNNNLYVAARGNNAGWEGSSDNGFFLFKYVTNDFQVVMHINAYDNRAYNQFGLMARLFGANGAPGGTPNGAFPNGRETFWRWFRFDEFGVTTSSRYNRNNSQFNRVADTTDGESTDYWLLMMRLNHTNFLMFKKAQAADPWIAVPSGSWDSEAFGPTLAGVDPSPLQVGIFEGIYTAGFRTNLVDYFMLDGPIASAVGTPPSGSPSDFAGSVDLVAGTLTLTWNNAADSDGSMVVVRGGKPVNAAPISGQAYTANAAFGLGSDLGSSNYVVYLGDGNTVTVSNLIGGVTYHASVYSYSNTAAGLVFNQQTTAAPISTLVGALQEVQVSVSGNNQIPLDGVGIAHATALFSGGSTLDVTTLATLTCDDPSVIVITNVNNLDGIALGTANLTAVYADQTNTIQVVVKNPTYTDNFTTSHDYVANGVAGTMWDGVYFGSANIYPPAGGHSFPNASVGGNGDGQTYVCDANVTSNGVLSVQTTATDWEFADDDGFLLFKYVPGDFQIRVHITADDTTIFPPQANVNCGVMARQYGPDGQPSGGALGTNENWVSWSRFDQYGITTDGRNTTANGATQRLETRDGSTNYWLLLVKDGANFHFFEKQSPSDLWIERNAGQVVRPDLIGGMQVGIQQATFSGNVIMSQFDSLMLDATEPSLTASVSNGFVNVTWPHVPGVGLQSTPSLSPADWQPVGVTPTTTNGFDSISIPPSLENEYFRLVK